tara:strand:+ start:1240 stop:2541 length:1302 start_codon:yes stop_codon:yes gene_type:complete
MEYFLQNVKKIDIKTFSIGKSIKKTKMNKDTKLNIQRVIHDIIQDGEISDSELLIPPQEIIDVIFIMVMNVEKKKKISCEEEIEIKETILKYIKKSIKLVSQKYNTKDIKSLGDIINELKKIKQPEQRTPEWHIYRKNRLTASDLGSVMGYNPYEKYINTVLKKCGVDMPFIVNKAILHGVKYEEIVTMIYEYKNNVKVYEYGCIPHPTIPHFGASPDGIVDVDSVNKDYIGRMIEIKCPTTRPITGFCPEYYWAQVQGQLDVCNLEWCDFVECYLVEYDNSEEYYMDVGSSDYYNSNEMEKGVIIDAYDIELRKDIFYYCELGKSVKEQEIWASNIIDKILADSNLEYRSTSYWKVVKYNALLIKRDVEWWNNEALPKINKYWSDVLEYRKKPMEELQKIHKPYSYKKKIKKETFDTFLGEKNDNGFLSDSD